MSVCVIEISDNNLRVGHEGLHVIAQPGYAFLSKDEVYWGDQAKAMSRLHPMHTYNQYWHQLSLDPLRTPTKNHRHYADLAYLQVESLYHFSQRKEPVIFATPANFTRSQLSLLLGIAQQCSFEVAGIVDSAIAAVSTLSCQGTVLFIDIQLHQTVISVLSVNETTDRIKTEIIPSVGLLSIQNLWAQYITDTFIAQSRFDPLHDATSEQALYNQLPSWIEKSQEEQEFFVEIEGKQAKLNSATLLAKIEPLYKQLQDKLKTFATTETTSYLSSSASLLVGLNDYLNAQTLSDDHIIKSCDDLQKHIISNPNNNEGIAFVTSLPVTRKTNSPPTPAPIGQSASNTVLAPTHLLDHHFKATPINTTTTIGLDGNNVQVGNALSPSCVIKADGNNKVLSPANDQTIKINGELVKQATLLIPGDILQFGESDQLLRAIFVET